MLHCRETVLSSYLRQIPMGFPSDLLEIAMAVFRWLRWYFTEFHVGAKKSVHMIVNLFI